MVVRAQALLSLFAMLVPLPLAASLVLAWSPAPTLLVTAFHALGAPNASGVSMQISVPIDSAPRTSSRHSSSRSSIALSSALARDVLRAALQHSGIGDEEVRLDSLRHRARTSALLPELRLRVAHVSDVRASTSQTALANSGIDTSEDTVFANHGRLYLEARLAFRLDRLLFADEEIAIERLAQELQEREQRIRQRVLEALFVWQRAELDASDGESSEAALRLTEAVVTLDLHTGGWFSQRGRK
jgi:hypothetical protein